MPEAVFPFRVPPSQYFGPGAVEQVGAEARQLGANRALVITDSGVAKAGIAARVREILEQAGVTCSVYDQVELEPSVTSVERAFEALQAGAPGGAYDLLVGVGGGSALDTAKGVSLRSANPGPLQQR
jgi:alcohol dehydrogenase class IV